MSANIIYVSCFADMIENMLLFRESLGLSKEPNGRILMNFDRFCVENYPQEKTLTKSLAMEWGAKRANEKINSQRIRVITLRQFAKYINFMGCEAYIIPTDMMGKQETYEPYLFTNNELTVFLERSIRSPLHRNHLLPSILFRCFFASLTDAVYVRTNCLIYGDVT